MTPAAVRTARRATSGRTGQGIRGTGRSRATATDRGAAPSLPRRLSGPVGGRARAQAAPQPAAGLGERALAVVRSLPDRSLIDGLVRGRAWIPVLGVLLAGLVAMQVEILKLGTSIGRSIERSTALQSQNESLQAGVATLANDERIERLAAGMGMTMPSPSSVVFVPANARNAAGRALANIHAPDPADFASQLAAQIAAAGMIDPASGSAATTNTTATAATSATTGADTSSTTATTSAASTSAGTADAASTAPGPASTSSQPEAAAPAAGAGNAAQASPEPASGETTAASPSDAAAATAANGAGALAPTSGPQAGTPSGG